MHAHVHIAPLPYVIIRRPQNTTRARGDAFVSSRTTAATVAFSVELTPITCASKASVGASLIG